MALFSNKCGDHRRKLKPEILLKIKTSKIRFYTLVIMANDMNLLVTSSREFKTRIWQAFSDMRAKILSFI